MHIDAHVSNRRSHTSLLVPIMSSLESRFCCSGHVKDGMHGCSAADALNDIVTHTFVVEIRVLPARISEDFVAQPFLSVHFLRSATSSGPASLWTYEQAIHGV